LDRHSFEIQIKELTQKCTEEASNKEENLKLKDFVKRQNVSYLLSISLN
jgi:hypothetical protein